VLSLGRKEEIGIGRKAYQPVNVDGFVDRQGAAQLLFVELMSA
jgi:hypothetical protein